MTVRVIRRKLSVMLKEFGPGLFYVDGPQVSFYGLPFPTRMAIIRLANGHVWVWSPIALNPELEQAVDDLGGVSYIVSPNKLHNLSLKSWGERWPNARIYAPPGLASRRPDIPFSAELGDKAPLEWEDDIEQLLVRGSFVLEELVFFHRESQTLILGDLVHRLEPRSATGLRGLLLRALGVVGEAGSTPLEWRASFFRRKEARAVREKILAWEPKRLLIAHGICAQNNATVVLKKSLAWM